MSVQATMVDAAAVRSRPMSREERKVILASSLGTVFEWYDFYLYGSLAAIIGAQFFSQYPEATRNVFALLAFAAGFLVARARGASLAKCLETGAIAAAEIISHFGARPEADLKKLVRI